MGGTNAEGHSGISLLVLALGDACVYLAATLIGFASHQELVVSATDRMLATWVPFTAAWLAVAAAFGLFNAGIASAYRSLWRVALAATAAAALGAWLRSLWLRSGIVLVFVLVMGGVTLAGLLCWRALYAWVTRRKSA